MEKKFERLEDKVDALKEDVSELKSDMKIHISKVEDRMLIDGKVLDQVGPLLGSLPILTEIAESHHFDKVLKKKRAEDIKFWGSRIGLISIIAGIVATISKLV
jgi:hypothetical protein